MVVKRYSQKQFQNCELWNGYGHRNSRDDICCTYARKQSMSYGFTFQDIGWRPKLCLLSISFLVLRKTILRRQQIHFMCLHQDTWLFAKNTVIIIISKNFFSNAGCNKRKRNLRHVITNLFEGNIKGIASTDPYGHKIFIVLDAVGFLTLIIRKPFQFWKIWLAPNNSCSPCTFPCQKKSAWIGVWIFFWFKWNAICLFANCSKLYRGKDISYIQWWM